MQDRKQMTSTERFDGGRGFLDAFMPKHTQMHFAIGRRGVAENRRPIDVPIGKERLRITRDREEKRATVRAGKFAEIFVVAERARVARPRFRGHNRLAGEDELSAASCFVGEISHFVRHVSNDTQKWRGLD